MTTALIVLYFGALAAFLFGTYGIAVKDDKKVPAVIAGVGTVAVTIIALLLADGFYVDLGYFVAIGLFILGLMRMSSPTTARSGIWVAGAAMVFATIITLAHPELAGGVHGTYADGTTRVYTGTSWINVMLIIIATGAGTAVAWISGKRVAMTDMPQMIALYNGMGGGAAAAIAAIALAHATAPGVEPHGGMVGLILGVLGALIGAVSFSGSGVAFAKLQGLMKKDVRFPMIQVVNLVLFVLVAALGIWLMIEPSLGVLVLFFILALVFGVMMTLPIGGADMPVVISMYNAFTGLAVAFEGYVLENPAMIIAGMVVGAAGTMLTKLMADAMNRSIGNVLFAGFGGDDGAASGDSVGGEMKEADPADAGIMTAYADKVIIVPGYGMAVAQAQHKVWEFAKLLQERGVTVKFAIHPVAGRMPGHMNVLLAEAGVPYDVIYDLDEINSEFATADVAIVIGANDVVNPVAKTDPASPIFGMPILDAAEAKNVLVVKRGRGAGFSGIENQLFFLDNTKMLYGDAQDVAAELIQQLKEL